MSYGFVRHQLMGQLWQRRGIIAASLTTLLWYVALPVVEMQVAVATTASKEITDDVTQIVVRDKVLHTVSPLLFGQFMEDAGHPDGSGEPGPVVGLRTGRDELRPDVMDALRQLYAPIIRFPGGYMAERHNSQFDYRVWLPDDIDGWTDPPLTHPRRRFGLLAFFKTCEKLGSESLVVVPTRAAFQGDWTIAQAASFAAGLVAFANAREPEDVEEKLRPWVRLRQQYGQQDVANVRYWQLGNEIWAFRKRVIKQRGWDNATWDAFQLKLISTMSQAMRAVDPSIILITDGMHAAYNNQLAALDSSIDILSDHHYAPWETDGTVQRNGLTLPIEELSAEEHWQLLVSVPAFDEEGRSVWPYHRDNDKHGLPIAFTEWNWNGWGKSVNGQPNFYTAWAKSVGAASFLHAIIRAGDRAKLATQSMMIGSSWGITSVQVEPDYDAFVKPRGRITAFYSRYHGSTRLFVDDTAVPRDKQPYRLNSIRPAQKVMRIDTLATANTSHVYIHLIHRGYDTAANLEIDLNDLGITDGKATLRLLLGRTDVDLDHPDYAPALVEIVKPVEVQGGNARFILPPKSIAVMIVERTT